MSSEPSEPSEPLLSSLVQQVDSALTQIGELLAEPESLDFAEVRADLERLETVVGAKAFIDAAFAFLAERGDAGRLVGSTKATDYLCQRLGLSRAEAHARVQRGRTLFEPPAEPETDGPADPTASETEERERREAEKRLRREREAQEEARRRAREKTASAEKQRIIETELRRLDRHAVPGRAELFAAALKEAEGRSPEDLRDWVRARVRSANRAARKPDGTKDPFATLRRRSVSVSQPDAEGGVHLSAYLPAEMAAAITAVLSPGRRPGHLASVPPEEDKRTYRQRMADQLFHVCKDYLSRPEQQPRGVGSIVVTMSVKDFEEMTPDSRFPTNTGHLLDPMAVLRLGAAGCDFVANLDPDSGVPLALGRTRRTASLEQKLALVASELVCTHPGCTQPGIMCDCHHIQPWAAGGRTDIENLTILCRHHHTHNRDQRDGVGGLGHAERDPGSGRVGYRPADGGPIRLNGTQAQQESGGAKTRRQAWPDGGGVRPRGPDEPGGADGPGQGQLDLPA